LYVIAGCSKISSHLLLMTCLLPILNGKYFFTFKH
jgi:hypothetical protein